MLSKDPSDYDVLARPSRSVPIETIADQWLMRGKGSDPSAISWAAIRAIASDPETHMCLTSDIHVRHIGHDMTEDWKALRMTKLEQRVAGRVVERMAFMEHMRDDFLTPDDARTIWHQESCRESSSRRSRWGTVRGTMDPRFYDLVTRIGHQGFDAVLHLGTPLMMSEGDDDTMWSCRLGRVSDLCSGGIIDAICVGGNRGDHVVVDIKCTDHSVSPASSQWNAKNQAQALMYFIGLSRVASLDEDVVAPRGVAFANPLRGVIEWISAEGLLAHMDVIETLARRGLWMSDAQVERLLPFIRGTLSR